MSAARSRPERNSIFWLDLPRGRMKTGMDWVSQWMDECKGWGPQHCSSKNGMNAWEKALRRGIWMEKEKRGWMRFARSEISAEFWRIGPRCHDSPIRSIPIFKHFAPAIVCTRGIRNLWTFPDGSILKTSWPWNYYIYLEKSLHTLNFWNPCPLSLSTLNGLQVRSYRELMFYNAFRKGTHPPMKWTGWVFTGPLIC